MAKDVRKTLRFSNDEINMIEEKIAGHCINFSEFARGAILGKKIHSRITFEMISQVKKIGVNLNQIAKTLNEKKSDIPNSEILKKLIEIQKQIEEFSHDS